MKFTEEAKAKIKEIIEGDAYNLYNDIVVSKEGLRDIAKKLKEEEGLEKRDFNKILKVFAEAQFDEQKAQGEQFNELYEEIFK